ncbi:hypothetical protein ACFVIM_13050 [Streptomyces sp. NPDC057638]|uniref:hypothetical protein n=1 Tax=Streptomyces sp. NPDC057638 TaxID=3346190 RepID=UPI0036B138A9
MIPYLVTVGHRRPTGRWLRLFIPVPVVLPVLLPLAVLAAVAAWAVFRVSPVGALRDTGRLLWALPGTRFEMALGPTALRISIR